MIATVEEKVVLVTGAGRTLDGLRQWLSRAVKVIVAVTSTVGGEETMQMLKARR